MKELISTFGVDWKLLLAQMVNFGIILFVLKRYAYGPILGMLQKRREIIEKGLEDASSAEESLRLANQNADEINQTARNSANAVLAEAQNEANQFASKAKYDALTEKGNIIASAQTEIENIKQKNDKLLKEKAVEHVLSTVRSILGEEVNSEMNARIIRRLTQNT